MGTFIFDFSFYFNPGFRLVGTFSGRTPGLSSASSHRVPRLVGTRVGCWVLVLVLLLLLPLRLLLLRTARSLLVTSTPLTTEIRLQACYQRPLCANEPAGGGRRA